MNVRNAIAQPLREDQVDDLHHRRIGAEGRQLGDRRRDHPCVEDRALRVHADLVENGVIPIECALNVDVVRQLHTDRKSGLVEQLLAEVVIARVQRGDAQHSLIVNAIRDNVLFARKPTVDGVHRAPVGLDLVQLDGSQAHLPAHGAGHALRRHPKLDQQRADRPAVLALLLQRLANRVVAGDLPADQQIR